MDLNKNGKPLCDLRKKKGMTQKEVADILGVVPKTVSKWEAFAEEAGLSKTNTERISKFFNLDI